MISIHVELQLKLVVKSFMITNTFQYLFITDTNSFLEEIIIQMHVLNINPYSLDTKN